jgi:hypothetical protein
MLHQPFICWNKCFFGVHTTTKMMLDLRVNKIHDTSLPLTRMLMALAVPAIVDINPPDGNIWPTSSGKMYVSDAAKDLALTIKLSLLAVPVAVTKLTLMVADEPL